jgi:hypothetical protein
MQWLNNEKHGLGTHSTQMGANSPAKNIPSASKFICPNLKVWDFNEKRLHWAFVVRSSNQEPIIIIKLLETFFVFSLNKFLAAEKKDD